MGLRGFRSLGLEVWALEVRGLGAVAGKPLTPTELRVAKAFGRPNIQSCIVSDTVATFAKLRMRRRCMLKALTSSEWEACYRVGHSIQTPTYYRDLNNKNRVVGDSILVYYNYSKEPLE